MNHMLNNRYIVVNAIGQGGMGTVYKAQDTLLGYRLVAIKEMSQQQLTPQQIGVAASAFKQEADMLAGLRHPNLPSIHEHFEAAGRWYLVMECIEGETLDDYLLAQGGKLPINEVLDIGIQLCTVLEYLHARQPPIIFRDLKPLNIMREPGGHLYLIDFGIARHFKIGQAKDTNISGTPGYAPPEQYGRTQSTPRTDIYSLGALLHELLSGIDPSDTPFRFSPLHLLGHSHAADLEALILMMVDLDENKRPATMRIVQWELQRIAGQTNTGARSVLQPIFAQPTVSPLQMPPTSVQTPPQMQALASSAPTMQALASSAPTQQAIAFHT
ncbi:MAG: serine/threonine-protein kinase, partial [Ktedonobacteraceae bacterium]